MTDMTFTDAKIEMSAAQITFGGTDLGGTTGGATFTYTVGMQKIFVDQSSMPRKHKITQEECQAVVNLSEYSFDNLRKALPAGTYTLDSGGAKEKIEIGGTQIVSGDYEELIITPVTGGSGTIDTDSNLKVTIYKAIAISNLELGFTKEGVRVIAITFDAIADTTKAAGKQLFALGDTTATA